MVVPEEADTDAAADGLGIANAVPGRGLDGLRLFSLIHAIPGFFANLSRSCCL
jgi:hypothetical protein